MSTIDNSLTSNEFTLDNKLRQTPIDELQKLILSKLLRTRTTLISDEFLEKHGWTREKYNISSVEYLGKLISNIPYGK